MVPGRCPPSTSARLTHVRNDSRWIPNWSAILAIDPRLVAGSRLASSANRVARSLSSGEYFLGAPIVLILPCNESLHQTRGDTYTYDASGRLTAIDYADRADATFTYTDAGRRATVTDHRGTTTYAYDLQGRLTSVASPEGSVGYGYDAASRLTSLTTAAGTTAYVRDALGRISQVTDPDGGIYAIARDSAGRVSALTYPNGVIETFTRDAAGRAMSVTVADALGTVLASHTAQRDVAGRITVLDDVFDGVVGAADVSRDFGYDAAGRLTQVISNATGSSSTVDYTLDGLGNRASTSTDGTVVASTVNDLDQLTTQGSNAFTYDDAGRLTAATGPAGTSTFAWSSQGELLSAATPAGTVDYAYDTDGNVTTRTETGVAVDFVYDTVSGLPRAVSASDGTWWVYADGMILAQHTGTGSTAPGTTAYLHSDVRGDVRTATDATGTVTDTWTWTVDGQLTARTGTTTVTVGWRGETVDTTTGLIWLRARWYDPTTARFLSADPWHGNPANPISLNRYAYANADPVNMHDPTGLSVETGVAPLTAAAATNSTLLAISIYAGAIVLANVLGVVAGRGLTALLGDGQGPVLDLDGPDDERRIEGTPETQLEPDASPFTQPNPGSSSDGKVAVYRVFGGPSGVNGNSWTTVNPVAFEHANGEGSFREFSGLPPFNTGENLVSGLIDAEYLAGLGGRYGLPWDQENYSVLGEGVPEVLILGGCSNPALTCSAPVRVHPMFRILDQHYNGGVG